MTLDKTQRQRREYNRMVENHEEYKKQLAKIIDKKGNLRNNKLIGRYTYYRPNS